MQITRMARPIKEKADVRMWHCGGCGVVHMSVGKMVLNFNKQEFSDLADAVADLSVTGWLSDEKAFSIIDLVATEDETGVHGFVH